MGKPSYQTGNIALFQRSYYRRRKAKYMGTSDPVILQKFIEARKKKQSEEEED